MLCLAKQVVYDQSQLQDCTIYGIPFPAAV